MRLFFKFLLFVFSAFALEAQAIEVPETEMAEVGIHPTLGTKVSLDREFKDESGKTVTFRSLAVADRPILLLPVYYTCPRLCGLTLEAVTASLDELTLNLGSDFTFITFSFDPDDTSASATERAAHFHALYRDPALAKANWHFLTASKEAIAATLGELGYGAKKDGTEFAHSTALYVLTHGGEISQYFTGIEFPAKDLRLGLVEASQGKIGSSLDHVMLFCFRFDPLKGRYTWAALNLMKAGGALTMVILGGLLLKLWFGDKKISVA